MAKVVKCLPALQAQRSERERERERERESEREKASGILYLLTYASKVKENEDVLR
jgi:hypothetical protein